MGFVFSGCSVAVLREELRVSATTMLHILTLRKIREFSVGVYKYSLAQN